MKNTYEDQMNTLMIEAVVSLLRELLQWQINDGRENPRVRFKRLHVAWWVAAGKRQKSDCLQFQYEMCQNQLGTCINLALKAGVIVDIANSYGTGQVYQLKS